MESGKYLQMVIRHLSAALHFVWFFQKKFKQINKSESETE